MNKFKRMLSCFLVLVLAISLLPFSAISAMAAESSSTEDPDAGIETITEAEAKENNALEAIGIDPSAAPGGYDPNDQSNPYGKDTITMNPVSELLLIQNNNSTLYGHANKALKTPDEFWDTSQRVESISQEDRWPRISVAGNFDGNKDGKEKQVAVLTMKYERNYVYTYDKPQELNLSIFDAENGKLNKAETRTLFAINDSNFANPDDFLLSTECQTTFQVSFLKMAAGDFDGDGVDEIAVYIGDRNNPRIEVYHYLDKTGNTAESYQNVQDNWGIVWSYPIPKQTSSGKSYTPNMVSLLAADIDGDGYEDLAVTYGLFYHYYKTDKSGATDSAYASSKGVALFGAKSDKMLQQSKEIPLEGKNETDGKEFPICRAAFAYGDLTGSGTLVVGGSSLNDIQNGQYNSRYLGIYQYDGTDFNLMTGKNYDLFAKEKNASGKEQYVYPAMSQESRGTDSDTFHSAMQMIANIAIIRNGQADAANVYLDSLLFKYTESGLVLVESWDCKTGWNPTVASGWTWYREYGAASADLLGYGYDAVGTMTLGYSESLVFSSLFFSISKGGGGTLEDGTAVSFDANRNLEVADGSTVCFPNTDKDTTYMKFKGSYYSYSDAKIKALLVSPPYFSDLANRDDLHGAYDSSSTSVEFAKGSAFNASVSSSIRIGASIGLEVGAEAFGFSEKVSRSVSTSIGASITGGRTRSKTESVGYGSSCGQNTVVLYSHPMVHYQYYTYAPSGDGTYEKQVMTVTESFTPAVVKMDLEKYEQIQKDYGTLPELSTENLTEKMGDPTSYSSSARITDAKEYGGDWEALGYDWKGSSQTSQSMSVQDSFSVGKGVSTDMTETISASEGTPAITMTASVSTSVSVETSTDVSTSEQTTYGASMQDMPGEAEEYNYGFSWKLCYYEGQTADGKQTFPVVTYKVTDVSMPPQLPTGFQQDMQRTTSDTAVLTWSYPKDKMINGFEIYRYYDFPDGKGSYEKQYVDFKDGVLKGDSYQFSFEDKNLSPYTDYYYQIQSIRGYAPHQSITSKVLTVKTKADVGYPELSLTGLDEDGTLGLYPDSTRTVTVNVANATDYPQGINYQWQKLENGEWKNVDGRKSAKYKFNTATYETAGTYRCRVNVLYYDKTRGQEYAISAYTDTFDTTFNKHKVSGTINKMTVTDGYPDMEVTLASATKGHNVAPSGEVQFKISNCGGYANTFTVKLQQNGRTSTATLNQAALQASGFEEGFGKLPEGLYDVTITYGGNRLFSSYSFEPQKVLSGNTGYRVALYNADNEEVSSVVYGDDFTYCLIKLEKDDDGKITETKSPEQNEYNLLIFSRLTGSIESQVEKSAHSDPPYYIFAKGHSFYLDRASDMPEKSIWDNMHSSVLTAGDYYFIYIDNSGGNCGGNVISKFTVEKRDLNLKVGGSTSAGQGRVADNKPYLIYEGTLASTDKLSDLVEMEISDSANRQVQSFDNNTLPGNYTITPKVISDVNSEIESDFLYWVFLPKAHWGYSDGKLDQLMRLGSDNYNITVEPSTYTVTGTDYKVRATVHDVDGNTPGKLSLYSPVSKTQDELSYGVYFSSGTPLKFLAESYEGYQIRTWRVRLADEPDEVLLEKSGDSLDYTMKAEDILLDLYYEISDNKLNVHIQPETGGSVKYPVGFTSGSVVRPNAELSFTAEEKSGYQFDHWEFVVGSTKIEKTDKNITIKMPASNADLYAVFKPNSYTLTLGSNLRASYTTDSGTKNVGSGAQIPVDTVVTVKAAAGFSIPADTQWVQDGEKTGKFGSSYEFTMKKDTSVTIGDVPVQQDKYSLTLSTTNGRVDVICGDDTTTVSQGTKTFNALPGGSIITLRATPNYGYVFDHWQIEEEQVKDADYTLPALCENLSVEAVFVKRDSCTVDFEFNSLQGNLTCEVQDPYGNKEPVQTIKESGSITICKGDTIEVKAVPKSSYMVDKWNIDGELLTGDHSKSKTFEDVQKNKTIKVEFSIKSYVWLHYSVEGKGYISNVTCDGEDGIYNGGYVGGGSTVEFTSCVNDGYVVEGWKINGEFLKGTSGAIYRGDVLTIDDLSVYGNDVNVVLCIGYRDDQHYNIKVSIPTDVSVFLVNNSKIKGLNEPYNREPPRNDGTTVYTYEGIEGNQEVWIRIYQTTAQKVACGGVPLRDRCTLQGYRNASDYVCSEETMNSGTYVDYIIRRINNDLELTVSDTPSRVICESIGNGTVTVDNYYPNFNDLVTITATPEIGYHLESLTAYDKDGYKIGVSENNRFRALTEGKITIKGVFVSDGSQPHNVTCTKKGSGTVSVSPTSATSGKIITIDAKPATGYSLASLKAYDADSKEIQITDNKTFTMPNSDAEVKAVFSKTLEVFCESGGHGSVSVDNTTTTEGKPIKITTAPDAGYALDKLTATWNNGGVTQEVPIADNTFTMPAGDVKVKATFARAPSITCMPADHGSISAPASAKAGTSVAITVSPDGGYTLKSLKATWKNGNSENALWISDDKTFTMPEGDVTLTAVFVEGVDIESAICRLSYALELGDSTNINVYVREITPGTDKKDYTLRYSFAGGETIETSLNNYKVGTLADPITVAKCTSTQYTVPVKVYLCYKGQTILNANYSVESYCKAVISGGNAYTDELKDLCRKVLEYGYHAQEYFGYSNARLPDEAYRSHVAESTTIKEYPYQTTQGNLDAVDKITVALDLRDRTEMNYYVYMNDGFSINNYTVGISVDGENYTTLALNTPQNISVVRTKVNGDRSDFVCTAMLTKTDVNGKYQVKFSGIPYTGLNQTFYIKVSDNLGSAKTLYYSPMAYAYRDNGYLMKALYNYHSAARIYFGYENK